MTVQTAEPTVQPQIVNADPRYPRARLIEPTTRGYLYLAASVSPGPGPFVLPSAARAALLVRLKELARGLERHDDVLRATVFRAVAMPPTARQSTYVRERGDDLHVADFDVIILIEATSPDAARDVRTTEAYDALLDALRGNASSLHIMAACNARRIGDVDTERPGLFLFNHFAAADPEVMLQLWEYLAGWYAAETGLDNSVALAPLEGEDSDYAIVNWARWDESMPRHFWHQLAKKSFWRYVPTNLNANHAASMPIYCRLA